MNEQTDRQSTTATTATISIEFVVNLLVQGIDRMHLDENLFSVKFYCNSHTFCMTIYIHKNINIKLLEPIATSKKELMRREVERKKKKN